MILKTFFHFCEMALIIRVLLINDTVIINDEMNDVHFPHL